MPAAAEGAADGPESCQPPGELPGYGPLKKLDDGGQGVVYLTWQLRPKRKVALKGILAGRSACAAEVHRFRRSP